MAHKTRPRLIYPGLWDSEKFYEMDGDAFKLWAYLLTHADDDGRGQFHLPLAASRPFLRQPQPLDDARAICLALNRAGLVAFYRIDGRDFYQMHDWDDFQRIRKDRYTPSTYPPPATPAESTPSPTDNQVTTTCQPSDNPNGKGKGKGKGKVNLCSASGCGKPAADGKRMCRDCGREYAKAMDRERESDRKAKEATRREPGDFQGIADILPRGNHADQSKE